MEWLRHAPQSALPPSHEPRTPLPVLRLRHLLNQIDKQPGMRERAAALVQAFWREVDAAALFADFGFGPRPSLTAETLRRLRERLLPGTPETTDLAALFQLLFEPGDAAWIAAIDEPTLQRLSALVDPGHATALLDAVTILTSAVQAAGYSPALRQRMDAAALQDEPFRQLSACAYTLRQALHEGRHADALREAGYLRALLDACGRAADSVMRHLEQYGVSVDIVYEIDQLHGRMRRIEELVGALLSPDGPGEARRLMLDLLRALAEQRGLRPLLAQHYSLLARQVTERSAETGEHYITRTRAEYRDMLRRAAGGGLVIAGTTYAKFAIAALGLSAFWGGFYAGLNYAASFVLVMLLHWTVATKQPAMTAPAMAASLPRNGIADDDELRDFVDRVVQLVRSQAAGIFGNVAICAPLVLAVQLASQAAFGATPVGEQEAQYVLKSITLLGPTALFAAFTGVLLFASSLIAGWAENAFVFHRLDSAIAWNPRFVAVLGATRAQRWSRWWRANVSGLAANISLGLMLGLVPPLLQFFGLPLDVRHVTLASGQLGAALGALGFGLLAEPVFWWCVGGIAATGVLNLTVSFSLAFAVALRSRGVKLREGRRLVGAIWQRFVRQPASFLFPPRDGP